jgi:hypothetical protein
MHLHFSDGIVEEYSSEDETQEDCQDDGDEPATPLMDPRSMSWFPWMSWMAGTAGSGMLSYADAAGEKLAWWFGITSPKYYYEIQEAIRMKKEEEERKGMEDAEMSGWTNSTNQDKPVLSELKSLSEIKDQSTEKSEKKQRDQTLLELKPKQLPELKPKPSELNPSLSELNPETLKQL